MRRLPLLLLLLVFPACDDDPASPAGNGSSSVPPAPLGASALLDHLNVLAHDSLFGRRAGSEWEWKAAEYIRDEFIEYGLEPGAPGYFQAFTISVPVDGQSGLASQNVLGVLPGVGALADEWVILGAHYDHVGADTVSGSVVVYNGADDNASGTALMLEVARYLSEYVAAGMADDRDRRSIMFQAYGSEEVGLIGSTYFCAQPTVAMEEITAMVNLDMVGRLRNNLPSPTPATGY